MDAFNNTTDAFSSENWTTNASSATVEYTTSLGKGDDPLEKVALASEILDHITAVITIIGFLGGLQSTVLNIIFLLPDLQCRTISSTDLL